MRDIDKPCKVCKLHTAITYKHIENGRVVRICNECFVRDTFDKEGNLITDEKIKEERKIWE